MKTTRSRERLELLHKEECDVQQVRYLYLNLPGTNIDEISRIVQVSRKRVIEIRDDPLFQPTIEKRREIEEESSRLVRAEQEERLKRSRERE